MTRDIIKQDPSRQIIQQPDLDFIKSLVVNGLSSENSKVMYSKALDDFLTWRADQGNPPLTKALVTDYKVHLETSTDYAPATINLRLSAIRRLAVEAADNGIMDHQLAEGVTRVKGVRQSGRRLGNWLTAEQAQDLLREPDITTLKGLRDRAVLAVLIGGGLRRSEASALTFGQVQQRQGRWVILDLIGKGNRIRTVPIPSWTKQALNEYSEAANISEGRIFRSIDRLDGLSGDSISDQGIADIVKYYARLCGFELAAHDLRRTFAKLADQKGADIRQIQLTLGHQTIKTTERYLNVDQNLTSAPCDFLGLSLD